MARTARSLPVDAAPSPWPDVAADDPYVEIARQFVVRVRAAMGERSIRSVAAQAGIHNTTLLNILNGRSWPDLATIARLEVALNADLYTSLPARHDLG
jgi:transcriptional regulator with XRE-family HTH domain